MSENDERKTFLTEKIFTTKCCNGQTDSSFDDTAEKFLSESQEENRSSFNDEQKKRIFSKKNLFNRSPWQVVISFDKTAICFPTEKPFIFRSMFEKDEKTYRKISKQMFVFKVILRTLRKQCRHLAEKKIDQRLINLRSMSKNNGEKYLRKIFSLQTGQIDKQKAALTTDRQVFVEMTYRSRSMPNDEKKNFSKKIFTKSSWTRGKQLWQICRLFFDEKKPLFLRSLSKNHWKNKQKLCQNEVMSSNWSFGLVESSVVNLAEKKFERRLIIFGWMSKNVVKKIFWQNFFHHKLVILTNRKQYWQRDRQISVEMTEKIRSMPNAEIEKELFRKKILWKKSPCKIHPWRRGEQFWQPCRLFSGKKPWLFGSRSANDK